MEIKKINNLLKENDLRAKSYKKNNNTILVDTNIGKLVIKENNNKDYIYDYLDSRDFSYYPKRVINDNYLVTKYIEGIDIPEEQKMNDLIDLVTLLHNKTTYYKEVDDSTYIKIYEDLENNFEYLYEYYNDLITTIDKKVFPSPAEYLIQRNITLILDSVRLGIELLESWYSKIENLSKIRVSIVHNNLDLSHYIRNTKPYLTSWNKSKIDIPIFDLYGLYNKYYNLDFLSIINRYNSKYPLKDIELDLFLILIIMPDKIKLNSSEFDNCKQVKKSIDKLLKSNTIVNEMKKSIEVD